MKKNSSEKKQSPLKTIILTISVFTILAAGAASLGAFNLYTYAVNPSGTDTAEKLVVIRKGQGFNAATSKLVNEGIITSPSKFKIIAAVTGKDKKIKAGEYMLSAGMSPHTILSLLVSGRVHYYRLTIPEGFNLHQIGDAVEKAGFGTKKRFVEITTNPDMVERFGINKPVKTLEGYLFPDTYHFPKGVQMEVIVKTMVQKLRSVYKKQWVTRGQDIGFSMHEVLTLASIIEKETGDARERPLISSVFHNRLKKNMRLETDPTVIYGIKDFDGNLTKKHLRTKTPYNTYKIKGLPPGPIANPGIKSIEAALYPAESDYLYFVSKKDTTHQFSTNIRDHINSVRKYQLNRR